MELLVLNTDFESVAVIDTYESMIWTDRYNSYTVTETDLDAALKEKVNAAAEGNHSHANKAFLDTLSGATDEEVTAMCTEVFGA